MALENKFEQITTVVKKAIDECEITLYEGLREVVDNVIGEDGRVTAECEYSLVVALVLLRSMMLAKLKDVELEFMNMLGLDD